MKGTLFSAKDHMHSTTCLSDHLFLKITFSSSLQPVSSSNTVPVTINTLSMRLLLCFWCCILNNFDCWLILGLSIHLICDFILDFLSLLRKWLIEVLHAMIDTVWGLHHVVLYPVCSMFCGGVRMGDVSSSYWFQSRHKQVKSFSKMYPLLWSDKFHKHLACTYRYCHLLLLYIY